MLLFCLLLSGVSQAKEDVVAVLSSELQPYVVALQEFQNSFGKNVTTLHLAQQPFVLQGHPQVAVAFGGKAALQHYPEETTLVYCMAPGTYLMPTDYKNVVIQVSMMPKPASVLFKIKALQPSIKHLAVLWSSPSFGSYVTLLQKIGKGAGIEILGARLEKPEGLPDRLREWEGQADALLVTADPTLISDQNTIVIAQFAWANHTPFYAAIQGMADKGAAASFSVSFSDIGRASSQAAKAALSRKFVEPIFYADESETTINVSAAAKAGLTIDPSTLRHHEKVIP